jgi:L-fuconolactonase
LRRREFIRLAAATAAVSTSERVAYPRPTALPILDAHVHLFDPTRSGGVPWPSKSDEAIYKPALPDRLEALASPLGVVGAIAIEASPLEGDNDWLLQMVARHPFIVGCIGNLDPSAASYQSKLALLRSNPLFLGIRYGNLWDRDLAADLDKPGFWAGLHALAGAGLVFESANPNPALIGALVRVAERLPSLRIVIDHLPNAAVPNDKGAAEKYWDDLRRLGGHPEVFVKLSEISVRVNGNVEKSADFYRNGLDAIWSIFGEDRVIFGSDWPNSDHVASYTDTLRIVRQYAFDKGQRSSKKLFWRNSREVYRWQPRRAAQRLA